MEEVPKATLMLILSGVLTGFIFGFTLQHSRYCMNAAFRDVILLKDLKWFRAWLLAILVAIIGANLIEDIGILEDTLRRQAFAPLAAIIGGYLFGAGVVITGGCGSGILCRQGEGQFGATVAILGFVVGIISTLHGLLNPVSKFLRSFKVSIGDMDTPALWDLVGGDSLKWVVIAIVAAVMIPVILKGKPFARGRQKGWSWSLGGFLVGLIIIWAWWASNYWGLQPRGLSFIGPTSDLFMFLFTGSSNAPFDPMFNILGIGIATWSALYIIGVPIGSYISARGLKECKLTAPREPRELVRFFFGGLLMGFGGAVAGG